MTETLTKKLKKKKGFTLIELIIVIAIIAIIAAFAVPNFMKTQNNSKIDADLNLGRAVAHAFETLEADGTIVINGGGSINMNIDNVGSATQTAGSSAEKIQASLKDGSYKLQTPAASAYKQLIITYDANGKITNITCGVSGTGATLYPSTSATTPFTK